MCACVCLCVSMHTCMGTYVHAYRSSGGRKILKPKAKERTWVEIQRHFEVDKRDLLSPQGQEKGGKNGCQVAVSV